MSGLYQQPTDERVQHLVLAIANEELGLLTLAAQNRDRLDFHEHAVWSIRSALVRAFRAGQQAQKELCKCK